MEQLQLLMSVTVIFIIRIGLPVLVLLTIDLLIDRWQSSRQS